MPTNKWDVIFTAGTHTDAAGTPHTFTETDLDRIVSTFDPAAHEPPLVVGHPSTDAPAYGWVSALKREGGKLLAAYKDTAPEFVDWVKRGLYKKKSVKLYPDGRLRHVGYLGAQPPAVKGLPNFAFGDNGEGPVFEFSEVRAGVVRRLFSGMRDFLIEKFTLETADKILPSWDIDNIELEKPDPSMIAQPSFTEGGDMPTEREKQLEADLAASNAEKAKLADQFAESEAKRTAAETEAAAQKANLAKIEADKITAANLAFCDGLVLAAKLRPAHKARVLGVLNALSGAGELEFAEGESTVKKAPVDALKEVLNAFPKQLEFAEIATTTAAAPQTGNAGERLAAIAMAKVAAGKPFTLAFQEAQRENIELANEYAAEVRK
jgi:hypothetical protein